MNTDEVEVHEDDDGTRRILVLAHEGLGGDPLLRHLQEEDAAGAAEVFITVPALSGSLNQLANDDRDEIAAAGEDLQRLLAEVGRSGRKVAGLVGDSDPRLALEDSLRQFAADAVIVVNPPESEMDRLKDVSTARAAEAVPLPVTVLHVPG